MRLILQSYYEDTPVIVKVLYTPQDGLWDNGIPDIYDLELLSVYSVSGKKSFDIEELGNRANDILSGKETATSGAAIRRDINVLKNPAAYSAEQNRAALTRNTGMLGPVGGFAANLATAGGLAKNAASRIVAEEGGGITETSKHNISKRLQQEVGGIVQGLGLKDTNIGRNIRSGRAHV